MRRIEITPYSPSHGLARAVLCACVLLLVMCGVAAADDWNVTWTPIKDSIVDKEYRIEVQNLQEVKRDVNLSSFFDDTNFNISELMDVEFFEWKLVPYNYTVDHYDEVNHSVWNETNQTWNNWTEQVYNWTETIESEKLDWKACKSRLFTPTGHSIRDDYGKMNIPKRGSKDTGDGTYNGTKVFLLRWRTPITDAGDGFGSSGKVAVLLNGTEYHPYWNASWSAREEIILMGGASGAQTDYQLLLNISWVEGMQADFDDLRFCNDTHEIDSWLESKVDSSYALVCVEFPTTPADGVNQTYYMYYVNAGVGDDWDIGATFLLGDDFSDGDYTSDPIWTVLTGNWTATSNYLSPDETTNNHRFIRSGFTSSNSYVLEFKGQQWIVFHVTDANNLYALFGTTGKFYKRVSGGWTLLKTFTERFDDTKNSITIEVSGATTTVHFGAETHSDSTYNSGYMGFTGYNYIDWADDVRIRKYAANPPSYAFGSTQYYAGSIHYNASSPYNHTIESTGEITANRTITASDDINWTAAAASTDCQLLVSEYNLANTTIANFTLYSASLDWLLVTNLSASTDYRLQFANGTLVEQQTSSAAGEANFTTDIAAGEYQVVLFAGYTPPDPTTLTNTTGNFWVNHTWNAGAGNVTDSYNISVNSVWHNTSPAFYNDTYTAHAWQNITVYALNSSGTGTLSAGNISQDMQIPNNAITITNTSDWSGDEGDNVYVDYDATDADSDTPTFSCNRTDLFTDFSTTNGTGNWTAASGTYYIDFGVSDGYGSTSNYTMTITGGAPFSIILYSVSPETIQTNYTGAIQVNYIVKSQNPLNLSSLAMLYGINYTVTGDMHSYIAAPPNNIASEGIYRAPNRNTTPYMSWEDNATITEGNVWQWGGGDNSSWWITKTPINATHTWINATGIPEHVFQSSFYLKKTSMYSAPKTAFEVNSQQGIIIKMWDNEIIRGRSFDYFMNLYFDTAWESTVPTDPIEIWYCNSSFNPDTDDPTGANCFKMVEWSGTRWVNHSWVPGSNASYARTLTSGAQDHAVTPDEINYIYLRSATQSSKSYVLNATNYDPEICNITYAQTETMWTYSELAHESTPVAYTPSFFVTFVRDDEEFLHHLYIADDQGGWAHSGINNISIGVSHYPVPAASIDYFNITCPTLGYTHDTSMAATYDHGYIHVGMTCPADPDGGTVSHNLTIHYINETCAGIINNTFTTTGDELIEINLTTSPYYSTTEAYTLKCVSTDDEGSVATIWLGSTFTLAADGTQGYYMNDYLMFWGMNDVPTLCSAVNNNSLISYDAGNDVYTMRVPFFKSKCNDTFRFNETVHLKSLNTEDVAYFRFSGETIFDNANIHGWNTVSDTIAPSTDAYRGYIYSCCRTTGNITNSNLSYLGSDVYRQEGINYANNEMEYLIYNTTFSHNSRGIIIEECENFNISHCTVTDNTEVGIGIYYSDYITVENCTISDSAYDPGLYLYESSDNIIRYNTIQDCVDHGVRIRSNSNNNTFIGNDITGSGIYDYYFSTAAINNTIRDPVSDTNKMRVTSTSEVNIENTDNAVFTEDSTNITHAYPTNFSMRVAAVSQTFNITQQVMTVTPATDMLRFWNLDWCKQTTFNASTDTADNQVWFNTTRTEWANSNMTVYRNGTSYYNGTADANGTFTYNYSGGWSEYWFEFIPENIAPDKPTLVAPANGATGTSTNPTLRVTVTDADADVMSVTFYQQGGSQIGSTQTGIANGSTASVVWSGRSYSTTYYWYAVANDGKAGTQSDTWHFTTQATGGGGGGGGVTHDIAITGCNDWNGNAGTTATIDFEYVNEDADAPVFTTNATKGTLNAATGVWTWATGAGDVGVYNWWFRVTNAYGNSDDCTVTVTVYTADTPLGLGSTTGNFWVDHTWNAVAGASGYNVSVNGAWHNGTATHYLNTMMSPHGWSNITLASYNSSTGESSFVSDDVQLPNNPITITNYSDQNVFVADVVYVDLDYADLDGDTPTFSCSRTDLFTDFNTATGTGNWTTATNGTYEIDFGVTDGWGSVSNCTMTVRVGERPTLPTTIPILIWITLTVLMFGFVVYTLHVRGYVQKIFAGMISVIMAYVQSQQIVSGNVVQITTLMSSADVIVTEKVEVVIPELAYLLLFVAAIMSLVVSAFIIKYIHFLYQKANAIKEDRKKKEKEEESI